MGNSVKNMTVPVIKEVTYFLAHVPSLVRHGSKPAREISYNKELLPGFLDHAQPFEDAVKYPPNQIYIGNMDPTDLWDHPKPWIQNPLADASRFGPLGEIMPEEEFYGFMKISDEFDILWLEEQFVSEILERLEKHPLFTAEDRAKLEKGGKTGADIQKAIENEKAMPLHVEGDRVIGCCCPGHKEDYNLIPDILIENLVNRASGALALRHLTDKFVDADKLEYLIGCGEEAVGDRYNRGGGNMAKAIGELAGCGNATGSDTKAFCCAPVHAMVIGSGLVASEVFENVAVVAGGSFAKLGMKFQGHLKHDMPVLENVIGGIAVLIGPDDGVSPVIRLDAVGRHDIQSGSSQQAILQKLVVDPLESLGLGLIDVDRFATEMHNPELTEPQGSGDVPKTNYRMIGSFAVMRKEIEKNDLDDFVRTRGLVGFSPTQGHIASAVPVLGEVIKKLKDGRMNRALFLAKGSLFLGRMTQLADGMSFILEKNENGGESS